VRSSAGQHVRSHSSKNVAVFSRAFDRNEFAFDRSRALRLCQGSVLARRRAVLARRRALCSHAGARGARTQKRCARTQARAVLARRSANDLEEAAVRSTARTAFDRTVDA
jgi:hypothetical protein